MTKADLMKALQARGIHTVAEATPGDLLTSVAVSEKDVNILFKGALALFWARYGKEILERGTLQEFALAMKELNAIRSTWTATQVAAYMSTCAQNGEYVNLKWKDARLDGRHYPFVRRVAREMGLGQNA